MRTVAIIKMCEIKKLRWYHCSIWWSSSYHRATYRAGVYVERFLSGKRWQISHLGLNMLHPVPQRSEREKWYKRLWQLNQRKGRLMSQSGDLWTPCSERNPWHQILINLPDVWLWWKLVLASVAALLEFSKKNTRKCLRRAGHVLKYAS